MTSRQGSGIARVLLGFGWLSLCAGGILAAWLWPDALLSGFARVQDGLSAAGAAGVLAVFAVATLVAASGIVPASLVGVAAGALYGTAGGFALASIATFAGGALSFWLARSVLRPGIARYVGRRARWRSFDALVARDGWRLVGLLRISPVMPFAMTSFALGLSSVGTAAYLAGTLAALPALFGFVALGSAAGGLGIAGQGGFGPLRLALLGIGGVATILVSALLGRHLAASARAAAAGAPESPRL